MALKKAIYKALNAVEVICKADDALDLEQSDWEGYSDTGDVSKLVFKPNMQPTIFLCNFELKGKQAEQIKNNMLGGKDEDGNPKVALGSWSFRVVKQTLKDIKNPADINIDEALVMKKDKDGLVHEDLLGELDRLGVINEIFGMFSSLAMGGTKANAKN